MKGLDLYRAYRSQGYAMATHDQGRDADGAPLYEAWGFAGEDDESEGYGWLVLRIHEIVETKHSGILVVYYRQWFAPDGEPAFGMRPRRRVGSLASVKALIRRRKMTPASVDERPEGQDPKGLEAKPASAVGAVETPKTSPIEAEIERLGGGA